MANARESVDRILPYTVCAVLLFMALSLESHAHYTLKILTLIWDIMWPYCTLVFYHYFGIFNPIKRAENCAIYIYIYIYIIQRIAFVFHYIITETIWLIFTLYVMIYNATMRQRPFVCQKGTLQVHELI